MEDIRSLLVAYDPSFTGLTTNAMAEPLEAGDLGLTYGGAGDPVTDFFTEDDPDGYYQDFSARLRRWAAGHTGGTSVGGSLAEAQALVVSVRLRGDSLDDSSDSDESADAPEHEIVTTANTIKDSIVDITADTAGDTENANGTTSDVENANDTAGDADNTNPVSDAEDANDTYPMDETERERLPTAALSDFIVETR